MNQLYLKEGSVYGYIQNGITQAVIYDCLTEKPITISNPSGQYHRFLLPIAKDGSKKICEVFELNDQEAYEQIHMFAQNKGNTSNCGKKMKADQLIPGNWYYHNDVLVKFINNVKTDTKGYRFESAFRDSYSAFSLNAEEIEKEITHELKFVADRDSDCPSCCLEYSYDECEVIGNCSMINRADKEEGYYIKSEIKS